MHQRFSRIADYITDWTGNPWASILAIVVVTVWCLGLFRYGVQDTNYQLIINTGTMIITFVMVFLIQHSTNRGRKPDNRAHLIPS